MSKARSTLYARISHMVSFSAPSRATTRGKFWGIARPFRDPRRPELQCWFADADAQESSQRDAELWSDPDVDHPKHNDRMRSVKVALSGRRAMWNSRFMLNPKDTLALQNSALFRDLPEDVLRRISDHAVERRFDPGDTIFHQGDPASWVFVVLEGLVKLSVGSRSGAEIIVEVFSTGQSFAEALAFQQKDYPVTATVILGARILAVPNQVIRAEIHAAPEVLDAILASAYSHLHRLVAQIEHLKGDTSLQRTARFILALAERGTQKLVLPFSKQTIAALIGAKPETLSRNFRKLEEIGVRVDGEIVTIQDVEHLRGLVFGK
jgi:CRP-like cAMP-binding protein